MDFRVFICMKLVLLDDAYPDELQKGEAIVVIGNNKALQLIICCPVCGQSSSSAGNHVFNRETMSYTPSVVHNKDLGGCGAHYWITNGEIIFC